VRREAPAREQSPGVRMHGLRAQPVDRQGLDGQLFAVQGMPSRLASSASLQLLPRRLLAPAGNGRYLASS